MSTQKRPGGHPARQTEAQDAAAARKAKAAAMRQREMAKERRRRVLLVTVVVLVVLAIVATVAILIGRERTAQTTKAGVNPPGVTAANGGYVLPGTPAAGAPTMDIWIDYQCPVCKEFETYGGDTYVQLATEGKAKVVVHTLSFLDAKIGNDASERAAEGAAAAAAQGKFEQYTKIVYANQPEEGVGYTDDRLQSFAKQAGVANLTAWRKDLDGQKYVGFVRRVEAAMNAQQVSGTPTVRVTSPSGKVTALSDTSQLLTASSPTYLQQAVATATGS